VCAKIEGRPHVIVEYGPGTGVVARELLKGNRLAEDGLLILIERDPSLASMLQKKLHDPRVRIFCDSAVNVRRILRTCGVPCAEYILSSIPLTCFRKDVRQKILEETSRALAPHGAHIVFLFRRSVEKFLQSVFPSVEKEAEPRNLPPLMIFTARKGSLKGVARSPKASESRR
jgi:phospholipid N-methyltransferase